MYTWEIDNYFRKKNYYLEDYMEDFHYKVFKTSPQIKNVKFEGVYGESSKYYVATDDANWTLWIKNKMA